MPRTIEIAHYSKLLAKTTILVARAVANPQRSALGAIEAQLELAFVEIFTLISHDANALVDATDDELELEMASRLDGAAR
jgi:hypothetical protein